LDHSFDKERALIWNPAGEVSSLHGNGYSWSAALGMNSAGTVVGSGFRLGGAHGFIWTAETGMVDPASLISNLGNFHIGGVNAINDLGQIAGWGTDGDTGLVHPVLLMPVLGPVPEPVPMALLSAGLVVLGLRLRQTAHSATSPAAHRP
jgi:uncharacterized membrane protein